MSNYLFSLDQQRNIISYLRFLEIDISLLPFLVVNNWEAFLGRGNMIHQKKNLANFRGLKESKTNTDKYSFRTKT